MCSRCKKEKPVIEFRAAEKAADNLHPWCRPCDSDYARQRRASLPKKPDKRLVFKGATWKPPTSAAARAYLAGIIDGEGTISYQEKGTRHYRVAVIMTCEETIRWLGQWGGATRPHKRNNPNPRYKPQWVWLVTGHSNVRVVLTTVLPYLVTKRETATDALAYIATRPGAAAPCATLEGLVLLVPHHASAESRPPASLP